MFALANEFNGLTGASPLRANPLYREVPGDSQEHDEMH